jgi:glyoxylase-like metal-dependent hydrolase (beta-lactamase superfamily II)
VLLVGFPAAAFATNCYVLAPGAGEECVVVDPGIGVVDTLRDVLAEHRLRPAAVLLTHGHADHVYSVTPVCSSGVGPVPALIHTDDRYRLADPVATMDPGLVAMLEQEFGQRATWKEPDDIRTFADAATLDLVGLQLTVAHAPGHTEGSVLFHLPDAAERPICISGDVLFAGSIGRTDLPGGDHRAMLRSLREKILPLANDTVVLPGHGPQTTIGRERLVNPFLRGL